MIKNDESLIQMLRERITELETTLADANKWGQTMFDIALDLQSKLELLTGENKDEQSS